MIRKVAIALSIFPGSLFILALGSFVICSIAERGLPRGSANIGLALLLLALVVNIPTIVAWILSFAFKAEVKKETAPGMPGAQQGADSGH